MDHSHYALTGDGWEIRWWPCGLYDQWNFLMTATPDFRAAVPAEMVRAFERQREAEPYGTLLRLAAWRTVSLDTDGRAVIEFEAATGERFAWTGAFERRNVDLEYRVDPYARRPTLPDEPRARGATPMSDERRPVYVDQMPDEPVVYLPVHRPRTVGERLAEIEARYDDQYDGKGVMPYRAFTDMGWLVVTLRRLLEERDGE